MKLRPEFEVTERLGSHIESPEYPAGYVVEVVRNLADTVQEVHLVIFTTDRSTPPADVFLDAAAARALAERLSDAAAILDPAE